MSLPYESASSGSAAMTDRPIIFSAPMILALLEGRKTMTRRLAWTEGKPKTIRGRANTGFRRASSWQKVSPGDRLFVREAITWNPEDGTLFYTADQAPLAAMPPAGYEIARAHISSVFMPRWASRLTLTVTATRIERLQNITEEDAKAEGVLPPGNPGNAWPHFALIWTDLHGPGSWGANPEVVAISFTVEKRNIDREASAK